MLQPEGDRSQQKKNARDNLLHASRYKGMTAAEYLRGWRSRNKEKMRGYRRAWIIRNIEKHLAYRRAWRLKNIDKERDKDRRWRSKNRLESNALRYAWRAKNPDKYRQIRSRVKAERKAKFLKATIGDLEAIKKIYARCQELRRWFDVVVDHIIPLACGGNHTPDNLQIIYSFDNCRKQSRLNYKPRVIFA